MNTIYGYRHSCINCRTANALNEGTPHGCDAHHDHPEWPSVPGGRFAPWDEEHDRTRICTKCGEVYWLHTDYMYIAA